MERDDDEEEGKTKIGKPINLVDCSPDMPQAWWRNLLLGVAFRFYRLNLGYCAPVGSPNDARSTTTCLSVEQAAASSFAFGFAADAAASCRLLRVKWRLTIMIQCLRRAPFVRESSSGLVKNRGDLLNLSVILLDWIRFNSLSFLRETYRRQVERERGIDKSRRLSICMHEHGS